MPSNVSEIPETIAFGELKIDPDLLDLASMAARAQMLEMRKQHYQSNIVAEITTNNQRVLTIGRAEGSDLLLTGKDSENAGISRRHAELFWVLTNTGLELRIRDVGSRHGSGLWSRHGEKNLKEALNGLPIRDGSIVRLASAQFIVHVEDSNNGSDSELVIKLEIIKNSESTRGES